MNKTEAKAILDRLINGTGSEQDKILFDTWYLEKFKELPVPDDNHNYVFAEKRISTVLFKEKKHTGWKLVAAILALMVLSASVYFTYKTFLPSADRTFVDIKPGGNRATLTLSNGREIVLDDRNAGKIADVTGLEIEKTDKGEVIYHSTAGNHPAESKGLNIITTPKGGQYSIILEDGTKVWLNAGSRLTFPASFHGREDRTVTLAGEAYFQVSKNPKKPFIVNSTIFNNSIVQQIKVTGTHFNVNCVNDEKIETTLAEGSVIVNNIRTRKTLALSPGQQSTIDSKGIQVKHVNPKDFTSWKDGLFIFNQTPLSQALQQIGNWYNCDVDTKNIPNTLIDGEIPRNVPLSKVLGMLERISDTKLTVEERRIMIK